MNWIYLLLALIAGMMMPAQGAINSRLSFYLQNPLLSSFFSFVVGSMALFIVILISRIPLSLLSNAKNAPVITWTGGLLGAFFVTAVVFTVPRLGVALTFSLIILGQMLTTLPIDHYGFLGVAVKEINVPRVIGVVLIIIGAIIIRRF